MIPIQKKKILIFIGIFILFVAIISVIYLYFNNSTSKNNQGSSTVNIYTDPGHYGIDKLLDLGITTTQMNSLESFFSAYASAQKTSVKEITISLSSMRLTVNKDTGEKKLTFTVKTDHNAILNAQSSYTFFDDMTLNLYDSTRGSIVYTSADSSN